MATLCFWNNLVNLATQNTTTCSTQNECSTPSWLTQKCSITPISSPRSSGDFTSAFSSSDCLIEQLLESKLSVCSSDSNDTCSSSFGDEDARQVEWQILNFEEQEKSDRLDYGSNYSTALCNKNICKNRYSTVLAMDKTRVKLSSSKDGSDYINANYVNGIQSNAINGYIATQAPVPATFNDFWRMIWEQKVSVVVMLTKLVESLRVKAHRYWPTQKPKLYGDIKVTLESIEKTKFNYKIKKFTLERANEKRILIQYHYLGWKDHGVPNNSTDLLTLMHSMDKHRKELHQQASGKSTASSDLAPVVVHCSAGIGRTGAFIIIHSVLAKLKEENKKTNDVNMKDLVSSIREQRAGVLTQQSQYLFCYDAVADGLSFNINNNETLSTTSTLSGSSEIISPQQEKQQTTPSSNKQATTSFTMTMNLNMANNSFCWKASATTSFDSSSDDDDDEDDAWSDSDEVENNTTDSGLNDSGNLSPWSL